jgi:hypothetical protein
MNQLQNIPITISDQGDLCRDIMGLWRRFYKQDLDHSKQCLEDGYELLVRNVVRSRLQENSEPCWAVYKNDDPAFIHAKQTQAQKKKEAQASVH